MSPKFFCAAASLALVACAATAATETSDQSSAVHAAEPAPDLTGTWTFDLEASDVAAPLREHCAKKSGGDAAKQASCWTEISAEASTEKIRFAKAKTGTVWTSFGDKGGSEVIFVEVPVELSADGPNRVLATVAGTATGKHAAHFSRSMSTMQIGIVDARHITIADPKKGRLVYEKTP